MNSSGKKPSRGKKFAAQNLGCHLDAWIIGIISKRKIGESRRILYTVFLVISILILGLFPLYKVLLS